MFRDCDLVALQADHTESGLAGGTVGTIVRTFADGDAFLVEFTDADGYMRAVPRLTASEIRSATEDDLARHARRRQSAAD